MSNLSAFISKYVGKKVDFHSYSAGGVDQCVDIVNFYLTEVWGVPAIIGTNAVDFPSKIKSPLEFVPETPTTIPEVGWVVVFKKYQGLYGEPGHIGIVAEKTDLNNLYVFEQNFPTGSVCTTNRHTYRGVVGYIRNIQSNQGSMAEDTIPVKKTDFENLVAKATKLDELARKNITEERVLGLEQVIESDRKRYDGYRETLATNLEAQNTWDSVIQQSATFSALKDKANSLEDKLDREEKQHDLERNQLLDELSALKARVEQQQRENETLLARLQQLESKVTQQEEKQAQIDVFKNLITTITKLFKKG